MQNNYIKMYLIFLFYNVGKLKNFKPGFQLLFLLCFLVVGVCVRGSGVRRALHVQLL